MFHKKITGTKLGIAISEAMGIEPSDVRRIILDIRAQNIVIAYVEFFGDERLLSIDWAGELKETKITESDSGGGSFVTDGPMIFPLVGSDPSKEKITLEPIRKLDEPL